MFISLSRFVVFFKVVVFYSVINDFEVYSYVISSPCQMMNKQTVDILYVSQKSVIARLCQTILPIFSSFLIFYCYFTSLKTREISRKIIQFSQIPRKSQYQIRISFFFLNRDTKRKLFPAANANNDFNTQESFVMKAISRLCFFFPGYVE